MILLIEKQQFSNDNLISKRYVNLESNDCNNSDIHNTFITDPPCKYN